MPKPAKSPRKSSSQPAAAKGETPQLPPRVVKKKKPARREVAAEEDTSPADPPSELLVPAILIGVSLLINVGTTLILRPESIPIAPWLGIRMALVVASSIITYGALFLAAQVLDVEYGYISTGAVKVAAITLTQAWSEIWQRKYQFRLWTGW